MVLVEFKDRLISADARKKLGIPNQYGYLIYGVARYGEKNNFAGIYQTRHYKGGKYTVREKFYVPTESASRIANPRRVVFASAVSAWQALSTSQKQIYNIKCSGKHMSGYNVFLHEYLISH